MFYSRIAESLRQLPRSSSRPLRWRLQLPYFRLALLRNDRADQSDQEKEQDQWKTDPDRGEHPNPRPSNYSCELECDEDDGEETGEADPA